MIETRNGEVINPNRPRWIEHSDIRRRTDVTPYQATTIRDAMARGSQVNYFTGVDDTRPGSRPAVRETDLTVFLCPLLRMGRYAVRVQCETGWWIRDFESEEAAITYQNSERNRLAI